MVLPKFFAEVELMEDICESTLKHVSLADESTTEVVCQESVFFLSLGFKRTEVLCIPTLESNLLSVSALAQAGLTVSF